MNPRATAWAEELYRAAPCADRPLLSLLALLLAGRAQSDALLIVGDALEEAAAEQSISGDLVTAFDLRRLAAVLRNEAPRRAV